VFKRKNVISRFLTFGEHIMHSPKRTFRRCHVYLRIVYFS